MQHKALLYRLAKTFLTLEQPSTSFEHLRKIIAGNRRRKGIMILSTTFASSAKKLVALAMILAAMPAAVALPQYPGQPNNNDMYKACDGGHAKPAGWTDGLEHQWCAMLWQEKNALEGSFCRFAAAYKISLTFLKGEEANLATVEADYTQAGMAISVDPHSALPPPIDTMLHEELSRTALKQMKANIGSMDLSETQILAVYNPALLEATSHTDIPTEFLAGMIWTESKGHPLTASGGLMQIGHGEYGRIVEAHEEFGFENRYRPRDNILAGALFLASKASPGMHDIGYWRELYHGQYQCCGGR